MNAGELRRLLANLPDDTPVFLTEPLHVPGDDDLNIEPFTDVGYFEVERGHVFENEGRVCIGRMR